jgi:hypothetical protein
MTFLFLRVNGNPLSNLDAVLERISGKSRSINFRRTKFLAEEIDFFGHTIGKIYLMAMSKDILAI